MHSSYCQVCDFTYHGVHEACPECGAAVELLRGPDAAYVAADDARKGSIGAGIGLLCLLHLLQIVFVADALEALFFMGVTQLVYALPAALVLAVKGRTRTMGGVLIGAGITFLLNFLVLVLLYARVP